MLTRIAHELLSVSCKCDMHLLASDNGTLSDMMTNGAAPLVAASDASTLAPVMPEFASARAYAIPLGSQADTCPVRSLRAWLDGAGIGEGSIFRSVDRWGRVGGRLADRDVARTVKRAAERAGLDPAAFSGHSLRAGLATSAALAGKSDRAIMATTGHKSRAMVDRYARAAERWRDNAAAGLL